PEREGNWKIAHHNGQGGQQATLKRGGLFMHDRAALPCRPGIVKTPQAPSSVHIYPSGGAGGAKPPGLSHLRSAKPRKRQKASLSRVEIALQRRAGADKVAVAVDIVDPANRWPVFIDPE